MSSLSPVDGINFIAFDNEVQKTASGQPCETAPITQVKILQRPRPHESSNLQTSHHQPAGGPSAYRNTTAGKPVEPGRHSEPYYANDDEWPSIADAESKSFGSQKQKKNVLQIPPETRPSVSPASSISHPTPAAQTRISHTGKAPKAPLKTYKERADEYAKARLRILGSAFSDDDDKWAATRKACSRGSEDLNWQSSM